VPTFAVEIPAETAKAVDWPGYKKRPLRAPEYSYSVGGHILPPESTSLEQLAGKMA